MSFTWSSNIRATQSLYNQQNTTDLTDTIFDIDPINILDWKDIISSSYTYTSMGKFEMADSLIELGLKGSYHFKDSTAIIEYYRLSAKLKKITDDFELAQKQYLLILNFYERKNNLPKVIETQIDLAEFYRSMQKFDKSKSFIEEAQTSLDANPVNDTVLAYLYHRKAALYVETAWDVNLALELSEKSLELSTRLALKDFMATSHNEIGYIQHNENLRDTNCLTHFKKAESLWQELGSLRYLANCKINIARVYQYQHEFKRSLSKLDEALTLATENNWLDIKGDVYQMKGLIYELLKDYKKAFENITKGHALKFEVKNNEFSEKVEEISVKYETAKNRELISKNEADIQKTKAAEQESKAERNQILIISIFLMVFLLFMFFSILRIRKKNKVLLIQDARISQVNESLGKSLIQKDALFKELHHRVKNNLSILSGLLYLQKKNLKQKEAINSISDTINRIKSIAIIHEDLYSFEESSLVNIRTYIERLTKHLASSFQNSNQKIKLELDNVDIMLDISQSVPMGMILNECITNSFEHAFENQSEGLIKVESKLINNDILLLSISDNGPGIPTDIDIENTTSLGLRLIHLLAEQLKAQVSKTYSENLFTISFQFKLKSI